MRAPWRLLSRVCSRILWLVSESIGQYCARTVTKWLLRELETESDQEALETLLYGMDVAFAWWPAYRENLGCWWHGTPYYEARCVFQTRDGVALTAGFRNGGMYVRRGVPRQGPVDVTVTFEDGRALRAFVRHEDILEALMANEVTVEGNLTYAWRFMFLVKDLLYRMGGMTSLEQAQAKAAQAAA